MKDWVTSNARNWTVSFVFGSVSFFSFEKSLCYFQYFNFTKSSNVTFQNFDVLKFVKRLCTAFKNFHVKNVCIMTSGCVFKNSALTQVLRKLPILTQICLCYTMRENIKIMKMQISFILYIYWPSYATFSMRRFYWRQYTCNSFTDYEPVFFKHLLESVSSRSLTVFPTGARISKWQSTLFG